MPTKFDLRLSLYTFGGDRLGELPFEAFAGTFPNDDPSTLQATIAGKVYGTLPAVAELALEWWNEDAHLWVEPLNARFVVNKDAGDDRDVAVVHNLSGAALIPWLLMKAIVENPADLTELVDGHRPFNSATPGAIFKTVLDEEQALGWGPFLTYDFDADLDSAGVPWASELSIAYKPGTTGWTVLSNLVAQGIAEMTTSGRVIHLWNPEHGADLSDGNTPTRVGRSAATMPVQRSLDDLLTDVVLFGEDGFTLALNNPSAVSGMGRLVASIQQGGVSDEGTATLLAQAQLEQGESIRQQITSTEAAVTASSLPWRHYQVGDWVSAWFRAGWVRVRVAELVVNKDAAGIVSVTPILNDRFLDLLARVAKRMLGIVGGAVAGGTGAVPSGEDRRAPKAPVGLVVASTGYWSAAGVPLSQVSTEWTAVTQGENSVAIEVAQYELWGRLDDGVTDWNALTTSETPFATWSPFNPTDVWLLKVRAQSKAGIWGEFSDPESVTMELPLTDLAAPSAPILTSSNSLVENTWDGLLATDPPSTPPAHFLQLEVEFAADEIGPYTPRGVLFIGQQRASYIGLGVGAFLWFRYIAVDTLGRRSLPSEARSIVVQGVAGADIQASSIQSDQIDVAAIRARHIAADVAGSLDLSANVGFTAIVGELGTVAAGLDAATAALAAHQLIFKIAPTEVTINQAGIPFQMALTASRLALRDNGVDTAWLTGQQLHVKSGVFDDIQIVNFVIAVDPLGTGAVMRKL